MNNVTINWATKVITVPQIDLEHISGTLYELHTDDFRLALKTIEASEEGLPFDDTHQHNTEVTIAGTTFARTIEIINGYSITFEDGQYTIRFSESNNNFFDVASGILNQNQVQIIAGNSAGLVAAGVTMTPAQEQKIDDLHDEAFGKWVLDPTNDTLNLYQVGTATVLASFNLTATVGDVSAYIERIPK